MELQLPALEEIEPSPRRSPAILDAAVPFGLPSPLQPRANLFGYVTPEELRPKKPLQVPFVPMFDIDFSQLPCDADCSSPILLHDNEQSYDLGIVSPELLPPTPPEPSPRSLSPEHLQPPLRRKMTPRQLQFSEEIEFPESPSLLIAEPGTPRMLEEMGPGPVYSVEPFDPSEIINLDGTYQ